MPQHRVRWVSGDWRDAPPPLGSRLRAPSPAGPSGAGRSRRCPRADARPGRWPELAAFFDGLERDGQTLLPVPVVVGPTVRIRGGDQISVSFERLDPAEVVILHGVPCTRERRALFDEMRRVGDVREAVVAADMMAAAELVSVKRMVDYAAGHAGAHRIQRVRGALALADEHSRSPNETRMRLVWQLDAASRGRWSTSRCGALVATCSGSPICWTRWPGWSASTAGADHRGARRHSDDVDRESRFRDHGLEFFRITGPDLGNTSRMVRRMAASRGRARFLPPKHRPWTLDAPPGWDFVPSLDEVLDERDARWQVYSRWQREGDPEIAELAGM